MQKKVDYSTITYASTLPPVLLITLKRFKFINKYRTDKIECAVEIPFELHMEEYAPGEPQTGY